MYDKKYNSRSIYGKLKVCRYLNSHKTLKELVPHTVSFSREHMESMLASHSSIYVKPDSGSQGMGIFKVKKSEGSGYTVKHIVKKKQLSHHLDTASAVYDYINKKSEKKLIIQKGIKLDRVNGRAYDIRVMVQRKPDGPWTVNCYSVKVGASKKIVTNYYQGGKLYTMEKLGKQQGKSEATTSKRLADLKSMSLKIAEHLSSKREGMHEMGIDFAYDRNQKLWVIEVNSNHPQFYPMKWLDPKAYKKMKEFAKSYGRKDA
ncbi:YheC/YheD family protein [Paenibacillus lupini]|uniref:YheC/YheD family protein n=1 Tax=Paenibacillus lupini TaxID=1450204 RepID=UPI00141DB0A7|nr:YheC/YheD family protein [Paenibacillus lupini]NIK25100.1 glutathione synthase/RimK-type ligase-like ATP-grasp enzyme [Paenibacillus lupini]